MRPPRSPLRLLLVIIAIVAVAWRGYREFVPSGIPFIHFWFASAEGPKIESPYDWQVVHVRFHDAGATHSGNPLTWLILDHWLTGSRVIAKGHRSRSKISW